MVSAPATIPATSEPIFNPGLAPTLAATRTCCPARSSSPMFWASRTAGISPACDTRFGSSNLACVVAAVCNNRIPEVPFRSWRCELQQPAFSQVKGHFCCYDTLPETIRAVDPGSGSEAPRVVRVITKVNGRPRARENPTRRELTTIRPLAR